MAAQTTHSKAETVSTQLCAAQTSYGEHTFVF